MLLLGLGLLGPAPELSALAETRRQLPATDTLPWWKRQLRLRAETLLFTAYRDYREGRGTLNPGNRVAALTPGWAGLYLRPEARLRGKWATLWAGPRLSVDHRFGAGQFAGPTGTEAELYFQTLRGRVTLGERTALVAGRYLRETGVSSFVNPNNPFLLFSSRLNPRFEQRPGDFVELSRTLSPATTLSLLANLGRQADPVFRAGDHAFHRGYALAGEVTAAAGSGGATLYLNEDRRFHLGGYAQFTAGEAVLLWADGALAHRAPRHYPQFSGRPGGGAPAPALRPGRENERLFFSGLVGGSFTLASGPTLSLEYYRNGAGYHREQAALLRGLVAAGPPPPGEDPRLRGQYFGSLGRAIAPGLPFLRRNYLFLEVNQQDVGQLLDYALRGVYGPDDGGFQFNGVVDARLGACTLSLVAQYNPGPAEREFARLSRVFLLLGASYFIY